MVTTGIRPGEKIHEILVSDEEAWRTYARGEYLSIKPMLPELVTDGDQEQSLIKEYSSGDSLLNLPEVTELLVKFNLMTNRVLEEEREFLR